MAEKQGGSKMNNIGKVRDAVSEFFKKTLKVDEGKVVRIIQVSDGWEADCEVFEESSFLKSLGLATKAKDRNIYEVKLDNKLEVQSYERKIQ